MAETKIQKKKVTKDTSVLSVPIYTIAGKETGTITLPESVFAAKWNADLVHHVVVSQQSNARTAIAHTKGRGEVRGGGRKPWRQKGTGRARHGSRRSPIWKGGGVTHGPTKDKDYSKKVNKKERLKALYVTLSQKKRDQEMLFVDKLDIAEPKTARAKEVMVGLTSISGFEKIGTKKHNVALVVIPENDVAVKKSFANFGNVAVVEARNVNPLDLLTYSYVIFVDPQACVDILESRSVQKTIAREATT